MNKATMLDFIKEIPTGIFAAASGALIGVLAAFSVGWIHRKKSAAMSWEALNAEIQLCHQMAINYLRDVERRRIALPLSRWPTTFYTEMMKTIIAEREIRPDEIMPIMAYYNVVDQINLAFEQVLQARDRWLARPSHTKTPTRWAEAISYRKTDLKSPPLARLALNEVSRLRLKISHLVGNGDENDVYTSVDLIVRRNCQRFNNLCWRLLFLRLRA